MIAAKPSRGARGRAAPTLLPLLGGLLAFAAFALAPFLGGCGREHLPALMADTAPPAVRVRLGSPRTKARLAITRPPWTLRTVTGTAFALRGGLSSVLQLRSLLRILFKML